MKKDRVFLYSFLCLFVLIGGLVRFWDLGFQSIWIDEGFTLNGALSIYEHGLPILDSGKFYLNGIFSTYLVFIFQYIFGFDAFNPWSARIPAALFGTFSIVIFLFYVHHVFRDRLYTILVTAVFTFFSWEVVWSRQIRGYTEATFFILTALYTAKLFSDSKRKIFLFISVASLIVAISAQFSALAFIPAVLLTLISDGHYLVNKKKILESTLIGVSLIAFLLQFPVYVNGTPIEYTYLLIGSFIACVWVIFDKKRIKVEVFEILYFLTAYVLIVALSPIMQGRYLFITVPFLIITFFIFVKKFCTFFFNDDQRLKIVVPCLISLFLILFYGTFFPKKIHTLERGSPQPDFKGAFSTIKNQINDDDIVISGFTQMHKVYLGVSGLWLKMNINGKPSDINKRIVDGRDYYANAFIVEDLDHLKFIVSQNNGFIVVDSMTDKKWPGLFVFLENNPYFKRVFTNTEYTKNQFIYVYRF